MLHLRSLLFNIFFYLWTLILMIIVLPALAWPNDRPILGIGLVWGRGNLWALRVICGLKVEWRGMEKIPDGPLLVAAKHQSAWETFAFFIPFRRPAYVYKRQLAYVPLFGWLIWKAKQIPVDRGRKGEALASITVGAKRAAAIGRQVMIFPEGTRRAVDAPPDYKFGVTHLYRSLGLPCQPVALNSGMFWSRKSMTRRPGTVLVEFLDPIPPGLPPAEFSARLEAGIEEATNRLIAESRARGEGE
ncbi:lysophospholipid acyltransferase family protein [Phreatobacter oligotrophus]|jgi:1-acyl-sn-glycerol-3-phosphate acyltransferase|uniref:1-acyl-sn-glycerol-3-phosphate acyltransferase n=1 Tax=Phreatobacter oligotrophus TaxID=1122261 RepID=A0A2T4ZEH8_9HYPH|nr:1-acyl-sn-glycerol-3-phosphate acyltransferase [Phreatobacter oligotrophus]MBX9991052.1 1-acyl-sn-glycerol-3-phosphate acyltransferase [Phreatobacter oligotrophus]PTM60297.1 1-acyl-sn-glycerol-3-phosphate acyltransferase [Phreatobacter oligotrophus]